ncbi:MAG: MalY/PatB family protein [Myxococcota bacterium]
MEEIRLGPLRIQVEHRAAAGPTLRVREASGHERLRFDCFLPGAHFHLDPGGADRVEFLPVAADSIDWTLGQLRADLRGWLARAGLRLDGALDGARLSEALDRAERVMRHPPLDLEDLALEALRARTGEKWRRYPEDVLPLWVADMDFPVAEPIRRRLRSAIESSDLGYPLHPLPTGLQELFAERMERLYGWRLSPRRVELLADVVQGIHVALQVFSEPGQGVVIQTPIYPPFLQGVRETGRVLVENPLAQGAERYEIDFDALRAAISPSTRILLLCNPHNPTGRVFTREELEGLAEIVLEHRLVIVSDEIHEELTHPGHAHVPIATLAPEVEAQTLTLTAASKSFNIAGLRCAVGVFGSAELRKRFLEVPRHLRGGLNGLGLEATRAAWTHSDPWLEAVRTKLDANRALLARWAAERLPGIGFQPPEATYLAWLDCRSLGLEPGPYEFFLEQARVALSDGRSFGGPGEGFVRLNFATTEAVLHEAVERMATALSRR